MKIFEKLFCKHKWKSHSKQAREEHHRISPTFEYVKTREYTLEVLICEHCGKIKKIEY